MIADSDDEGDSARETTAIELVEMSEAEIEEYLRESVGAMLTDGN